MGHVNSCYVDKTVTDMPIEEEIMLGIISGHSQTNNQINSRCFCFVAYVDLYYANRNRNRRGSGEHRGEDETKRGFLQKKWKYMPRDIHE